MFDSSLSPLIRPPGGWDETSHLSSSARYHPAPNLSHLQLLQLRPLGWSSCFSASAVHFPHSSRGPLLKTKIRASLCLLFSLSLWKIPLAFRTKHESLPNQPRPTSGHHHPLPRPSQHPPTLGLLLLKLAGLFPPQGLCICSSPCLEGPSPDHWLLLIIQVSD